DGECTQMELLQHCKERLADFKVPRMIEFRTEIPKSPLGKILRKSLVDDSAVADIEALGSTLRQHLRSAASRAQRHSLVKQCVRQQLARILGLDVAQISLSKALSDFGLDSARAIELQICLEHLLGVGLSATMVWQYPDLDSLSGYLVDIVDTRLAGADPVAAPDRAAGSPTAHPAAIQAIDGLSDDAIEALLRSQVDGILQPQNPTSAPAIPGLTQGDSADMARLAQLSDEDVTDLLLKEFARLSRTDQPEA
ncbi:MAG TPA: phosphopantetheine-binding protein, partial [Herpetosiphonaceae bacterium]|nr:phosphopantetheine-binding protein [Herpetosiphonaceae bacterium]